MFACGCLVFSPEYKKSWDDGNRIVYNVILQVVEGSGKKMKKNQQHLPRYLPSTIFL